MTKQTNTKHLPTIKHPFRDAIFLNNSTMPTHSHRLSLTRTELSKLSRESQEKHPLRQLPTVEGSIGVFEWNDAITDDKAIDLSEMY